MRLSLAAAALGLAAVFVTAAPAQELVMFTEAGCPWCARWDAEIGPIYPKTEEGRRAPLRRVDLHAPRPEDLSDVGRVFLTPTFVLVLEGREIGRIEGYPGEDFFWGFLGRLFDDLPEGET